MRKFAALAITTVALSGPVQAETIFYDGGGKIGDYLERAKTADSIEIKGPCKSACTLLLNAKRVCVTRAAKLYFHLPSEIQADGTQRVAYWEKDWTMGLYPEAVQDLIEVFGGLNADWTVVPGDALIDYADFPDCGQIDLEDRPKLG